MQRDDHDPSGDAGELVRTIPDPGFADDAGAGDPRVARALADHAAGAVSSGAVLSLLHESTDPTHLDHALSLLPAEYRRLATG